MKKKLPLTAVSRNGWFYFSKSEITQPKIYISLQQCGKLSPLREAAERYASFPEPNIKIEISKT